MDAVLAAKVVAVANSTVATIVVGVLTIASAIAVVVISGVGIAPAFVAVILPISSEVGSVARVRIVAVDCAIVGGLLATVWLITHEAESHSHKGQKDSHREKTSHCKLES